MSWPLPTNTTRRTPSDGQTCACSPDQRGYHNSRLMRERISNNLFTRLNTAVNTLEKKGTVRSRPLFFRSRHRAQPVQSVVETRLYLQQLVEVRDGHHGSY